MESLLMSKIDKDMYELYKTFSWHLLPMEKFCNCSTCTSQWSVVQSYREHLVNFKSKGGEQLKLV